VRSIVRLLFFSCVIFGTAVGCSGTDKPVSKADIAAVEVTLTSAVRLANACLTMPTGPCRDPVLRPNLIADVRKAGEAFYKVRADNDAGQSVSLTALNLAITQLVATTPAIPPVK